MSNAKIEIKVGQIQFSGEGEQDWVAKQLDKILAQAEKLIQLAPQDSESEGKERADAGQKPMGNDYSIAKKTLPVFLFEKNAAKNQTRKFLATAVWWEAKGHKRLQTVDITKALKASNQTRLGNPADALNKNVSKGFCEKEGNQFFVTDDGKKSL